MAEMFTYFVKQQHSFHMVPENPCLHPHNYTVIFFDINSPELSTGWNRYNFQRLIQDFPEGVITAKRVGEGGKVPIYYLAKFCLKLHGNEENWTARGACAKCYYVDPPLVSDANIS